MRVSGRRGGIVAMGITAATLALTLVITGGWRSAATAQLTDGSEGAMAQLAWLVGGWEGDGWVQYGPDRHTFRQVETVTLRLGGRAMLIEGLGFAADLDDEALEGEPFHEALAVVTPLGSPDRFSFRAYRADGAGVLSVDAELELTEDGFIWSFHDPRSGHIRFTARRTKDDLWHEIGEVSQDGTTWFHFLEMTLARVPTVEGDEGTGA